jgi:hypothetical protein
VTKGGSDAAAGTQGAPWLTIAKALATAVAGDTVFVGPGVYREQATAGNSGTSGNPITFTADVDGSNTLTTPGEVRWSGYDNGDKAAPTGANPVLTIAGKNYLTFGGFTFQPGSTTGVSITGAPTGLAFADCTWLPGTNVGATPLVLSLTAAAAAAFARCRFFAGPGTAILVTMAATGAGDYNVGVTFDDCFVLACRNGIILRGTGSPGFGGGVLARRCTIAAGLIGFGWDTGIISSGQPSSISGSVVFAGTGISAVSSGPVLDGGNNVIFAQTALSNVTAAAGTITDGHYAPIVHIGQEQAQGRPSRHFLAPPADSPFLGFYSGAAGLSDLLNRPRPAGGASANLAVGALEAHDLTTKETTTVPAGKSTAIKWTGPADSEFRVPVGAQATTISVQVQWDGSYGAGTKPQLQLLANGEVGVAAQSVTATGSSGAWNTISIAAFTPTAAGEVRLRLVSSAAAAGVVYWGDATISPASPTDDFDHFIRAQPVGYLVPAAAAGGGGAPRIGSPFLAGA